MLSTETVAEFKKIYLKEYGVELTNDEATKQAIRLLTLMKAIYKPIPNTMNTPSKEVK